MDNSETAASGVPKQKKTKKPVVTEATKEKTKSYMALSFMAGAFIALAASAVYFKLNIPDEIERYLIGGAVLGAGAWAVLTLGSLIRGEK